MVTKEAAQSTSSPFGTSLIAMVLMTLNVVFWSASFVINVTERMYVNSMIGTGRDISTTAALFDRLQVFMALSLFGIVMATIIVFCLWMYRVTEFARQLNGNQLNVTPWQAVFACLIPIINFYKPYIIVRDVSKASNPSCLDRSWLNAKACSLVLPWWITWIFANIISRMAIPYWNGPSDFTSIVFSNSVSIATSATNVIAATLCFFMIKIIQENQIEKERLLFDQPPPKEPQKLEFVAYPRARAS